MKPPTLADVAELVRLPAVLSVPGDAMLGAAAAGARGGGAMAVSSCLFYLAGMALNDYADREIDAAERPSRPLPSGRVSPTFALGLATGLTVAGIGVASAIGGRRALRVALPLAGAVWTYDMVAKDTPLGPAAMTACRVLDVLLGASSGNVARALPTAAVIGAHTASITMVSRHEVTGGDPAVPRAAKLRTIAIAGAAAALTVRAAARLRGRWAAAALGVSLVAQYGVVVSKAFARAERTPEPAEMQRAVGAGVMGLAPLQAGMLAGHGAIGQAAAIASARPLARALGRKPVS